MKITRDKDGYKYSNVYKNHLTKLHSIQSQAALDKNERERQHQTQVSARPLPPWVAFGPPDRPRPSLFYSTAGLPSAR